MPKYRITLSDGRTFEVEADQQPSEADVMAKLGLSSSAPATPSQQQPEPYESAFTTISRGLRGPVAGVLRAGGYAMEHPVGALALTAGALASPFTAGASLPAAMAIEGAAAGAGTLAGHGVQSAQGRGAPASAIAQDVALGTAGGALGPAVGRAIPATVRGAKAVIAEGGPIAKEAARFVLGNERVAAAGRVTDALGRILGRLLDKEVASPNAGGTLVKSASSSKPDDIIREAVRELRAATPSPAGTLPPEARLPAGYVPRSTVPAPTPPLAPSQNVGGRLVPSHGEPAEAAMADMIEELRTMPSPPGTLPPEPFLPAGYTPRSSVPNRMKFSADPAPPAPAVEPMPQFGPGATAGPPRAVTPASPVATSPLPASWRPRTGKVSIGNAATDRSTERAANSAFNATAEAEAILKSRPDVDPRAVIDDLRKTPMDAVQRAKIITAIHTIGRESKALLKTTAVSDDVVAMAQQMITERGMKPTDAIKLVRGSKLLAPDVRQHLISALMKIGEGQ